MIFSQKIFRNTVYAIIYSILNSKHSCPSESTAKQQYTEDLSAIFPFLHRLKTWLNRFRRCLLFGASYPRRRPVLQFTLTWNQKTFLNVLESVKTSLSHTLSKHHLTFRHPWSVPPGFWDAVITNINTHPTNHRFNVYVMWSPYIIRLFLNIQPVFIPVSLHLCYSVVNTVNNNDWTCYRHYFSIDILQLSTEMKPVFCTRFSCEVKHGPFGLVSWRTQLFTPDQVPLYFLINGKVMILNSNSKTYSMPLSLTFETSSWQTP